VKCNKNNQLIPNLSLKADHPPPGFLGFALSWSAAGVGLARALGNRYV
jgi:hypothetical protein